MSAEGDDPVDLVVPEEGNEILQPDENEDPTERKLLDETESMMDEDEDEDDMNNNPTANGSEEDSSQGSGSPRLDRYSMSGNDFADDEISDEEEGSEDSYNLYEDLDIMEDSSEEEEEEEASEGDEEDNENENEEEEDQRELEALKYRRKLFYFTKYKQDKLINTYLEAIMRLKVVRKKNLYLQDRMYKHLQEKNRILAECREVVAERKEKSLQVQRDELRVQLSNMQFEYLNEQNGEQCEESEQETHEEEETENDEQEDLNPLVSSTDKERKFAKKCRRMIKLNKAKLGKGPSKLARLSEEHYHFDQIRSSSKGRHKAATCIPTNDGRSNNEEDKKTNEGNSGRKKTQLINYDYEQSTAHMNDVYHEQARMAQFTDEDQWRIQLQHKHTINQQKRVGQKLSRRQMMRMMRSKSKMKMDKNKYIEIDENTLVKDFKKIQSDGGGFKIREIDEEILSENQREIVRRQKVCQRRLIKGKSIMVKNLDAIEDLSKAQENTQVHTDVIEEEDEDVGLPDFKYEMSDLSLTKMKYGDKLRQEMNMIMEKSRFGFKMDWPLKIQGLNDYFNKSNSYGRVIYTMRLDSQIRNTKKAARKYKYVLHNYNYQMQQFNVMKEIHSGNMKQLEISRNKWETLMKELLHSFLQEVKESAEAAIDSYGKRIPRHHIDHWSRDVTKECDTLHHTNTILFRVLLSAGIAIRHLSYSESQGEGVELYEFKHLLRTNETIGAQYYHKREDLRAYKTKCRSLTHSYKKQLHIKEFVERDVNQKFILSSEISCLILPKQKAVKIYEAEGKHILKVQGELLGKAGIVPFKHLVVDYEKTFNRIAEKRQERRDSQIKFNSRVREVHRIFDNMEEIQRIMPELFAEAEEQLIQMDPCGDPIVINRPNTAPAGILRKKSNPPITEIKPFVRESVFFSKIESRQILENAAITKVPVKTSKDKLISTSKSNTDLTSVMKPPKLNIRPKTASIVQTGFPISNNNKRSSLTSTIPSSVQIGIDNPTISKLIADEEAKSIARARKKSAQFNIPTASKTGIVPKVTRQVMIKMTKPVDPKMDKHHHKQKKFSHPPPSFRPATAPARKYEMEDKNWPYHYYVKQSSQVEHSSKRRMDVTLGKLNG